MAILRDIHPCIAIKPVSSHTPVFHGSGAREVHRDIFRWTEPVVGFIHIAYRFLDLCLTDRLRMPEFSVRSDSHHRQQRCYYTCPKSRCSHCRKSLEPEFVNANML